MPHHHDRVQYPELKGSELHEDLKNDPGKNGDPDHARKADAAKLGDAENDK